MATPVTANDGPWLDPSERPLQPTPAFRNSDGGWTAIPSRRVPVQTDIELLQGIAQLLAEMLAVQRQILAVLGTSSESRSSVQLEQNSKGTNLTVKAYADSPIPGDEALREFGRIFREKVAQEMTDWAETVEQLSRRVSR